jgi:hypothetical protein
MKNLFVLLLAASSIVAACSGDDDDSSGNTGGTSNEAGKAGTAGTAGKAGGGSSAQAGMPSEGGSAPAGAGMAGMAGAAGAGMAGAAGAGTTTFSVTIENVATPKSFVSGGVFNTPVGDANPGPATPGKKYEFTIDAGRKQKLSFVTMLAASNDLFFGPNGDGIALYDENGDPISGDVTDQVMLWDAGTEVNEEPHEGPNTVTKQAGPDTGPAENGNVVDIADTSDPFAYPSPDEVLSVMVTHLTGTQFKITITNVSAADALMTTGGDFPAPISPGVWVVHNGKDPLFTVGMPDRSKGLERIAEDGNPAVLGAFVAGNVGLTYPASPGVWLVHSGDAMPLFTMDAADYADGLEHIAEDGNPTMLGGALTSADGFVSGAVFNTPVGAGAPGPILPGSKYGFSFAAAPGDALSFVSMLAATNDVFFGPGDQGIALFDADGLPLDGDITDQISLWDAGTEGNERPGIGPNTVTNQLAPDTGTAGEGKVQLLSQVNDGFTYPGVDEVLKVTITHD